MPVLWDLFSHLRSCGKLCLNISRISYELFFLRKEGLGPYSVFLKKLLTERYFCVDYVRIYVSIMKTYIAQQPWRGLS